MPEAASKPKAKPKPAAQAAQAEVAEKPEPKTVTWRGLTLTLPDELPNTFFLDIAEFEASSNIVRLYGLLRSIVGGDQFMQIRNSLTPEDPLDDVTDDLFAVIFGAYGLTVGESSASADS